jgi:hypothetical protein
VISALYMVLICGCMIDIRGLYMIKMTEMIQIVPIATDDDICAFSDFSDIPVPIVSYSNVFIVFQGHVNTRSGEGPGVGTWGRNSVTVN